MLPAKMMQKFEPKVCEELGCYVYLYIDPRTHKPFYIGKGQGNRVFHHLNDDRECDKVKVINEIRKSGQEPILEILKYGLTDEQALLVESTAIDLMDVEMLTNEVRGHGGNHGMRGRVEDIAATLGAEPLVIAEDHPVILINIARAFRYGMSPQAIYDATRSAWKVGEKRHRPRYAFSVYARIVREVFIIVAWVPGGSTMRGGDADGRHQLIPDRYEFVGQVADESVRKRYIGKRIDGYMALGSQNPIKYVNCGKGGETGEDEAKT
jgi:hypothetical protein